MQQSLPQSKMKKVPMATIILELIKNGKIFTNILIKTNNPGIQLYDEKLNVKVQEFYIPTKKYEYTCKYAGMWFDIDPHIHRQKDYYVLSHLLANIDDFLKIICPQKIIIIRNADYLSDKAQFALKRTVEVLNNYKGNIKFVFVCQHLNKINGAIISRSIVIHLPMFIDEKQVEIYENYTHQLYNLFRNESRLNLVSQLLAIRTYLFTLIPKNVNFTTLIRDFTKLCINEQTFPFLKLKHRTKLCDLAQLYEHRIVQGNNVVFHVEAFLFRSLKLITKQLKKVTACT